MLNEERDLLIKEVCARLPYGAKCKFEDKVYDILGFAHGIVMLCLPFMSNTITTPIENIELYLLPLSSMNEEQIEELEELCDMYVPDDDYWPYAYKGIEVLYKHVLDDNYSCKLNFKADVIDWFNKNNLDYRGLIDKVIVKDATNLNIY